MKFSHVICASIPNSIKFDDKKERGKVNLEIARKQQEVLNETLREVTFLKQKIKYLCI